MTDQLKDALHVAYSDHLRGIIRIAVTTEEVVEEARRYMAKHPRRYGHMEFEFVVTDRVPEGTIL